MPGTSFLGQGFVFGVLGVLATSIHMKGHTSNYNVSTGVGDELGGESFGVVIGAQTDGAVLEDCVASFNGDLERSSVSAGIDFSVGQTATPSQGGKILNCVCNNNQAKVGALGIGCFWVNVVIENCEASYNQTIGGISSPANNASSIGAYGFDFVGTSLGETTGGSSCHVVNCVASHNQAENSDSAGFKTYEVAPFDPNANPVFKAANKVTFENCKANNNISTNFTSYGFALGNPTDDEADRNSVECQLQNCIAKNNKIGFSQRDGFLNTFIGNTAEGNTPNYDTGIPQGLTSNVVTFTKATGVFSGPGVVPPTAWSNLSIV